MISGEVMGNVKNLIPATSSPQVRPNPRAQYTMAPRHMSSQFLIKMFTVFLDLKDLNVFKW